MLYSVEIFENGRKTPQHRYESGTPDVANEMARQYAPDGEVTSFIVKRFIDGQRVNPDWGPLTLAGQPACECKVCGALTRMRGTQLCDQCYHFKNGVEYLASQGISIQDAIKRLA